MCYIEGFAGDDRDKMVCIYWETYTRLQKQEMTGGNVYAILHIYTTKNGYAIYNIAHVYISYTYVTCNMYTYDMLHICIHIILFITYILYHIYVILHNVAYTILNNLVCILHM